VQIDVLYSQRTECPVPYCQHSKMMIACLQFQRVRFLTLPFVGRHQFARQITKDEIQPYTAQWSLYVPHSDHCMYRTAFTVCIAQWSLYVPHSGHYLYRPFNFQQYYVLPTQCTYVFCVDLRTNSDYFPIQH
jgi:hypothetical protein